MAQEKLFENKIKNYLTSQGSYFIKYWGGGQFTKSGVPDILACVNGHFPGIEVKASKGRPSELQIHHRDEIRKAGGISIIVYPEQFDMLKRLIHLLQLNMLGRAQVYQLEFDKEVKT